MLFVGIDGKVILDKSGMGIWVRGGLLRTCIVARGRMKGSAQVDKMPKSCQSFVRVCVLAECKTVTHPQAKRPRVIHKRR